MTNKKTIYFLCTGNSCRSQMAEGWAKQYLGDEWNVYSAGLEAHGLNPNAVKAMQEAGIDITNQTSDVIDPNILNDADLVVTLCGHAADHCPAVRPNKANARKIHVGFDDPAGKEWSEFQRVRDEIRDAMKYFAEHGKFPNEQ
ncbi:arsenate reductase (thioredoxin) [Ectobacillus antri]|jgi:arsenate reductase|uniref:Arsenate reductase n=1 Tax=Ectobacillus antri TaxID=2486280 RepID=A0ABT6H8M8_9BACI|nr:arsenate reductase (thioredoxin) [Ectobacillus antri]MDG4658231.1 arsenate reductase (thioredoxin) [Ectobacillus antri]MDG5755317.1 arsenate reductase (thioredoxin) [Ectobacillus antri]